MTVVTYEHKWPGKTVKTHVIEGNMGKHKQNCLCFQGCKFFQPDGDNCHIAAQLYAFDVDHDIVTPVWECPKFEEKS